MNDENIKNILNNSKVIAMIGVSSEKKGEDKKNLKRKPANIVMKYMQSFGFKVIPINPFALGEVINGEKVISNLKEISTPVDIVDVFRPSAEAPGIAEQAIKMGVKTLWLQYGIKHPDAKRMASEANINYFENLCIKQEYQRIFQKMSPVFPALKA
jgi:predicted CoA-binding protein|tara:strand:+ start:3260 stop:3727 length:468 start_codon:yes stop_codon:yes gene_type:complete